MPVPREALQNVSTSILQQRALGGLPPRLAKRRRREALRTYYDALAARQAQSAQLGLQRRQLEQQESQFQRNLALRRRQLALQEGVAEDEAGAARISGLSNLALTGAVGYSLLKPAQATPAATTPAQVAVRPEVAAQLATALPPTASGAGGAAGALPGIQTTGVGPGGVGTLQTVSPSTPGVATEAAAPTLGSYGGLGTIALSTGYVTGGAVEGDVGRRAVGGAITGATAGAIAGTYVFPGIGTAAGAVVGGAVGAVGGALSGYF